MDEAAVKAGGCGIVVFAGDGVDGGGSVALADASGNVVGFVRPEAIQWLPFLPSPEAAGMEAKMSPWVGVDLDRTLAHYDRFVSGTHIGEPILPMVRRVQAWLAAGVDVRVFTARIAVEDPAPIVAAVQAWCVRHIGVGLPVTATKDFGMVELWDDRAVQVLPNRGHAVVVVDRAELLRELCGPECRCGAGYAACDQRLHTSAAVAAVVALLKRKGIG
ncbi:MAG TPA: hypothetical protein VMV33_17285 [Rhodocyclaceae bacterium]|nr:hypothetical protein [Rhodocyclaceae bacterium]